MRLDLYLVKMGYATGRDRAKEIIGKGSVTISGKVCKKPSAETEGFTVEVSEEERFVGRGAYKIKKAFDTFGLSVEGKLCLDAGASTGGFTQYMLKMGAKHVFAVDVGTGQLAEELVKDERVSDLEQTDIRELELPRKADFFSADVSFISLRQILPDLKRLTEDDGEGVCLVKPQFEAGREFVGKKGVVKDRLVHVKVLKEVTAEAYRLGFFASGLTPSPITGQNGNVEYLLYLKKKNENIPIDIEQEVNNAWEELV